MGEDLRVPEAPPEVVDAPERKVLAVVGAGPGIGDAVARRFAAAGYAVGLVARNAGRLAHMGDALAEATGVEVATAPGDATDPDAVRSALRDVVAAVGPPSVLCFSPIPDVGLIRPVLETPPEDLIESLRLNVAGAAAAVETVLPAMLERGRGSLLFTTGSAGLSPDPARAASAVTTTAATTYVALLREALAGTGVGVWHTVIVGPVAPGRPDGHEPATVADRLWAQHVGRVADFPSFLRLP